MKWSVQSWENKKASWWLRWRMMRFRSNKTRCGRNFSATANHIEHQQCIHCLSVLKTSNIINIIKHCFFVLNVITPKHFPVHKFQWLRKMAAYFSKVAVFFQSRQVIGRFLYYWQPRILLTIIWWAITPRTTLWHHFFSFVVVTPPVHTNSSNNYNESVTFCDFVTYLNQNSNSWTKLINRTEPLKGFY